MRYIAFWCNGNTFGFEPKFIGSNPIEATVALA